MQEPAAVAARLFVLEDTVGEEEVRQAFGGTADLVACGLADHRGDALTSRVNVNFAGELCVLGDHPRGEPTGVPPLGGGTLALLAASAPRVRVETALDLGCGAGAIALALAASADRVVATDVSARALAFAGVNARFNGVTNVELREGDLFEAVRGETFDLIVSQPPFVACPPGCARSVYAHGGPRGDELVMRALSRAAPHISPRGRLIMLADVPVVDGDPLDARLGDIARDGGLGIVALQSPTKSLDEYCVFHAAVDHPLLDEAFAAAVLARREHLERQRIRGITLCVFVAQPAANAPFASIVPVRHANDVPVTGVAVDRILTAQHLAHGEDGALLASRLSFPVGSRHVSQPSVPGGPGTMVLIHLPQDRPQWPIVLDERSVAVVSRIAQSARVGDAARSLARDEGLTLEQATKVVLTSARAALSRGALELDERAG